MRNFTEITDRRFYEGTTNHTYTITDESYRPDCTTLISNYTMDNAVSSISAFATYTEEKQYSNGDYTCSYSVPCYTSWDETATAPYYVAMQSTYSTMEKQNITTTTTSYNISTYSSVSTTEYTSILTDLSLTAYNTNITNTESTQTIYTTAETDTTLTKSTTTFSTDFTLVDGSLTDYLFKSVNKIIGRYIPVSSQYHGTAEYTEPAGAHRLFYMDWYSTKTSSWYTNPLKPKVYTTYTTYSRSYFSTETDYTSYPAWTRSVVSVSHVLGSGILPAAYINGSTFWEGIDYTASEVDILDNFSFASNGTKSADNVSVKKVHMETTISTADYEETATTSISSSIETTQAMTDTVYSTTETSADTYTYTSYTDTTTSLIHATRNYGTYTSAVQQSCNTETDTYSSETTYQIEFGSKTNTIYPSPVDNIYGGGIGLCRAVHTTNTSSFSFYRPTNLLPSTFTFDSNFYGTYSGADDYPFLVSSYDITNEYEYTDFSNTYYTSTYSDTIMNIEYTSTYSFSADVRVSEIEYSSTLTLGKYSTTDTTENTYITYKSLIPYTTDVININTISTTTDSIYATTYNMENTVSLSSFTDIVSSSTSIKTTVISTIIEKSIRYDTFNINFYDIIGSSISYTAPALYSKTFSNRATFRATKMKYYHISSDTDTHFTNKALTSVWDTMILWKGIYDSVDVKEVSTYNSISSDTETVYGVYDLVGTLKKNTWAYSKYINQYSSYHFTTSFIESDISSTFETSLDSFYTDSTSMYNATYEDVGFETSGLFEGFYKYLAYNLTKDKIEGDYTICGSRINYYYEPITKYYSYVSSTTAESTVSTYPVSTLSIIKTSSTTVDSMDITSYTTSYMPTILIYANTNKQSFVSFKIDSTDKRTFLINGNQRFYINSSSKTHTKYGFYFDSNNTIFDGTTSYLENGSWNDAVFYKTSETSPYYVSWESTDSTSLSSFGSVFALGWWGNVYNRFRSATDYYSYTSNMSYTVPLYSTVNTTTVYSDISTYDVAYSTTTTSMITLPNVAESYTYTEGTTTITRNP